MWDIIAWLLGYRCSRVVHVEPMSAEAALQHLRIADANEALNRRFSIPFDPAVFGVAVMPELNGDGGFGPVLARAAPDRTRVGRTHGD